MQLPFFYNSYSKKLEPLETKEPGKVRIYHCGPTVYKRQHIGNMRRYIFADTLRRTLELLGYEVREIMNITDVGHLTEDDLDEGEDKLEKEARLEKKSPLDIAEREVRNFEADLAALNIQPAHKYPRATQHIKAMQSMVQSLLERGAAYQTDSGIYFDVTTFPAYGKLSGNTLDKLEAGKRIDVRSEKKHPADFALWIFDNKALQKWESPWGTGYPGWHIECSAMACEYLDMGIDIHTGGIDNKFPHHENEIAQAEAATNEQFVRYWMHNAHLQMGGKKLAKRAGEQVTLDTVREQGYSPLALRLLILGSHYRTPMEFDWELLEGAQSQLDSIKQLLRRLQAADYRGTSRGTTEEKFVSSFKQALADDLNTPAALAVFWNYVRHVNQRLDDGIDVTEAADIRDTLREFDRLMGILGSLDIEMSQEQEEVPPSIKELLEKREEARKVKDFAKADEMRDLIDKQGYEIEDTTDGPRVKRKI